MMKDAISRKEFLSLCSMIPITGFLGFKKQPVSEHKLRPKLTEEQRKKIIESIRRELLGLENYSEKRSRRRIERLGLDEYSKKLYLFEEYDRIKNNSARGKEQGRRRIDILKKIYTRKNNVSHS